MDSGWNTLSPDNITALIGQNESGKTSVLEALYSFFDGTISEDMLRSDLSMPEVSCAYLPESDEMFNYIDSNRMPAGVIEAIKENGNIMITRKWFPDLTSRIFIDGPVVADIFDEIEKKESLLTKTAIARTESLINECKDIENEISEREENILRLENELERSHKKQKGLKLLLRRSSNDGVNLKHNHGNKNAGDEHQNIKELLNKDYSKLTDLKSKLAERNNIKSYCENCLELIDHFEKIKPELETAFRSLSDVEESLDLLQGVKEQKAGEVKLFETKENYLRLSRKMTSIREETGFKVRVINNLLDNKELPEAEIEAKKDYEAISYQYSRDEAGELFFQHIPRHDFFEDFSSLLPNRIDLEDIFENNTRVEGHKAVRNFLMIAGLDPEFFKQTNNRILKQKIENLNNEVTVDFQEYWRQNVGKTNKIRIHFELEHYDISHPEKKGKPYLEFWIKDQFERLYPKQRSRGVRWFLSFYLELKAFAKENKHYHRVLLIDEPGLSLHARAQEDVLKVFEDIKGKLQIVYTTHSPHLIDQGKLHRLLAVQRANEHSEQSETIIYDASHLHSATSDTLSPICSLLGTGLTSQEFLKQSKNVIVEDITSYYYLSAFHKLLKDAPELSFLPANGPASVTTLVNLLIGWGFKFSVLLFDNEKNQDIISDLQTRLHNFSKDDTRSKLQFAENIQGPEDIFSTLDFKKHIIKKRIGISGTNSEFIRQNEISRPLLAVDFSQTVLAGNFAFDNFDEETRTNIRRLFSSLAKKITTWDETV